MATFAGVQFPRKARISASARLLPASVLARGERGRRLKGKRRPPFICRLNPTTLRGLYHLSGDQNLLQLYPGLHQ